MGGWNPPQVNPSEQQVTQAAADKNTWESVAPEPMNVGNPEIIKPIVPIPENISQPSQENKEKYAGFNTAKLSQIFGMRILNPLLCQ